MGKRLKKFDVSGKTALLTGAAGLLGIQHASALLETGANLVLTDIDDKKLSEVKETLINKFSEERISSFIMDVSEEESILDTKKSLAKEGIYIDILINNAAINPTTPSLANNTRTTRLENFSIDRWEKELSVGLTGAFLCSKVFGLSMVEEAKGGVILNISSDLSVIAPDQRLYWQEGLPDNLQAVKPVTYSVIKTGLIGLTRYLSTYWIDKGIRANSLSPGGVFNNQDEEFLKRIKTLVPMGRMAEVDEYRSAVQFLCSDASKYMNGQNIVIDGGRSVI